jgi:CBS domain-containing protein
MPLESIFPIRKSQTPLITCQPGQSIQSVARLMEKHNVGCVVVVEQGVPKGIVTDRDLLLRALSKEPAISVADPVRLVMTSPVKTITLKSGLHDAISIMKDSQIRRLPVVNSLGEAVSIVTFSDLYALIAHEINDLQCIISTDSGFEFGKKVA